jgi:glycosyltransferase involved in cell wall biosynthesis
MRQRRSTISTPGGERDRAAAGAPQALGGLTVVLACHDDAARLPEAVRDATAAAARCALAHEVVIVDDGSADDSVAIAGGIAVRDPRVRLVVRAGTLGYGETLRSGIAAARMPWVLLTDAGLRLDARDLEDVLPVAASADLVVGWRVLVPGTLGERAEAALWNRLLRAAFALPARDVDCAFRLGRRELLAGLDLRAGGALVGAELLVKSRAAGARTAEVPIYHAARVAGGRRRAGRRLTTRTLREAFDLRRAMRRGEAGA